MYVSILKRIRTTPLFSTVKNHWFTYVSVGTYIFSQGEGDLIYGNFLMWLVAFEHTKNDETRFFFYYVSGIFSHPGHINTFQFIYKTLKQICNFSPLCKFRNSCHMNTSNENAVKTKMQIFNTKKKFTINTTPGLYIFV